MPANRSKRVTLYDVARHAGVSYQTVSRVINGYPHVAVETRARILQVIDTLDYRPNATARSLATHRSCTFGVVTYGLSYYGPVQMLLSVERAAKAGGYSLRLTDLDAMALEDVQQAISGLRDQLVDGILLIMPTQGIRYDYLCEVCGDIPFVELDTEARTEIPSVTIDQSGGSRLATQHLLDLGHRAIAEICGPRDWFSGFARHESWSNTLLAAGLTPGLSLEGDWSAESGYRAASTLIDRRTEFTGLVVGNDQMALGASRALREHGYRIPENVSVVGFDDIPESAYFEPPLTTVRQDFPLLGQQSVEYLISLIEEPDTPFQQRVLPTHLIERASTRRLP